MSSTFEEMQADNASSQQIHFKHCLGDVVPAFVCQSDHSCLQMLHLYTILIYCRNNKLIWCSVSACSYCSCMLLFQLYVVVVVISVLCCPCCFLLFQFYVVVFVSDNVRDDIAMYGNCRQSSDARSGIRSRDFVVVDLLCDLDIYVNTTISLSLDIYVNITNSMSLDIYIYMNTTKSVFRYLYEHYDLYIFAVSIESCIKASCLLICNMVFFCIQEMSAHIINIHSTRSRNTRSRNIS